MAGVTTREEPPTYAPPAPQRGVATRKYVTEFIGTFFLTFAVAVAALTGSMFVPLAAGATLMVMIYAGGHISGAHYNPAVTMAALVRGRIGWSDAAGYWVAQFVGGILGALLLWGTFNTSPLYSTARTGLGTDGWGAASHIHVSAGGAFLVEVILTAVFVFAVLQAISPDIVFLDVTRFFLGVAIVQWALWQWVA